MLVKTLVYRDRNTGERKTKEFMVKGSWQPKKVTVDSKSQGEKDCIEFTRRPEVEFLVSYYSADLFDKRRK